MSTSRQPVETGPCPVCHSEMVSTSAKEIFRCATCGHLSSHFLSGNSSQPNRHALDPSNRLDEGERYEALKRLRLRYAMIILHRLAQLRRGIHVGEASGRLCDVGCGHGWFLESARQFGWSVTGIEPDEAIAQMSADAGHEIRRTTFPEALQADEKFDVIAFNDVWEHLPDPHSLAAQCREHLTSDGLLSIVIPSRNGILYRVASLVDRLGWSTPLERLWQKSFPCPHLHYYSPSGLERLLTEADFRLVHQQSLPSIMVSGLWSRLKMDRKQGWMARSVLYGVLVIAAPMLKLAPKDMVFQVYRVA